MNARRVIGIGCDDHGDQVAGLLVARRVAAEAPDGVTVVESCGAPAELTEAWRHADEVTVVEAMPGAVAGTIDTCQPHPRPSAFGCSPTRLSPEVREALATGQLPTRITVVTIAAQRFSRNAGVSPEVAYAAHRVATGLLAEFAAVVHAAAPATLAPPVRQPAAV